MLKPFLRNYFRKKGMREEIMNEKIPEVEEVSMYEQFDMAGGEHRANGENNTQRSAEKNFQNSRKTPVSKRTHYILGKSKEKKKYYRNTY